jgi:hypothetical protein
MDRLERLLKRCRAYSGNLSPEEKADCLGLLIFDPDIAVENEDGTFRPMMKLSDGCEIKIW